MTFITPANPTFTDASTVVVSGRVEKAAVDKIGLEVNGTVHDVSVRDGAFSSAVPIALGENRIRSVSNNLGVHLLNHSDEIVVHGVVNPGPITFTKPEADVTVVSEVFEVEGAVRLSDQVVAHDLRHFMLQVNERQFRVPIKDRRFRLRVPLRVGSNRLQGLAGLQLKLGSEIRTINRVADPGGIEITSPRTNQFFEQRICQIAGTVANPELDFVDVFVNGVGYAVQVTNGQFLIEDVHLSAGVNEIYAAIEQFQSSHVQVATPIVRHDFHDQPYAWLVREGEGSREKLIAEDHTRNRFLVFDDEAVPEALDLTFVIDTSGSMGNRLKKVKENANAIIRSLKQGNEDVRIGIVRFASGATIESKLTETGNEPGVLDELKADGGRADSGDDLYLGVIKALHLNWRKDAAKAILVITDEGASKPLDARIRIKLDDPNFLPELESIRSEDLEPEALKLRARNLGVRMMAIVVGKLPIAMEDAKLIVSNKTDDVVRSDDANLVKKIIEAADYAREMSRLGMWQAPESILATLRDGLGMTIEFDQLMRATPRQRSVMETDDVLLVSQKHTLVYRFQDHDRIQDVWQRYQLPLTDNVSWKSTATRSPATTEELFETLQHLEQLLIRADFKPGHEVSAIDNFMLTDPRIVTHNP